MMNNAAFMPLCKSMPIDWVLKAQEINTIISSNGISIFIT